MNDEKKELPLEVQEMVKRIAWLLQHLWAGNVRRMAEEVGLTHGAISKIVGGRQGPGRRVLTAIGSYPRVNPAWLYQGEGEPLLAPRKETPSEGWSMPIAAVLLPGAPSEHAALLSGETFSIPSPHHCSTGYYFRVSADDPIVHIPGLNIAYGDLLMMETNRSVWVSNPRILSERICAVRLGDAGPKFVLAKALWGLSDEPIRLLPLVEIEFAERVLERFEWIKMRFQQDGCRPRKIRFEFDDETERDDILDGFRSRLVNSDRVVAYCVCLIRR